MSSAGAAAVPPAAGAPHSVPLVVDALNFLHSYFLPVRDAGPRAARASAWTLLAAMRARVDGFLRACERSRFEPHFVIDAGWKSEEAGRKWTERREKEVRGGRRDIPLSADTFLADALHASGAKVYTVEGTDGDDVIARLAHELSASEPGAPSALVLSADRDMFRYDDLIPNAPERVFADFSFLVAAAAAAASDVSIELHPSPNPTPKPGVVRRAASDVPAYDPVEWTRRHDKLREVLRKGEYVRGACSPLTRAAGNLHGIARPLRRAAYAAMGAADAVREAYPEWDEASGRVRWVDDRVAPFDAAGEETAPSEASEASEASCSAADASLLAAALADVEGAGPANALAWLDARDERGRGIGATAREDVRGFRAFARVALVAEIFAAVDRRPDATDASALAHLLRLRTAANADGTESSSDDTTRSGALLAFPPTNRVMSARAVCAEASCRASFCVSSSEREYLEKKGFDLPRRCRPCRDERKKRNDGRPRGFEPGSWRRAGDTIPAGGATRRPDPPSPAPSRGGGGGAPTTATPFATRPRTLPPPRAGGGRGRGRGRDAGGRGAASDAREAAATPDALADALAATSVNE